MTVFLVVFALVFAQALYAGGGSESAPKGPVVIKCASVDAPGGSMYVAFEHLMKEIGPRTNGAVTAELHASSQLGNHRDYIDGLQINSIQLAEIASSVVATVDDAFAIFDMPYISPDERAQVQTLKAGADKLLRDSLLKKTNLYVAGFLVRTPRNVYCSTKPIRNVNDFKDLKIRTMESPPMLRAMELLGAKATPIPTSERYMALQTKVVDAAENNSGEIYFKKEYEVTKYISKTSHIIQPNVYIYSNAFLQSLSADVRATVLTVTAEATDVGTKYDFDNVDEIEKKLSRDHGMLINDIPDKSAFIALLQPLYKEYAPRIGQDLMDSFLKK
ncbi:MAG: TRAP transporter substrate-binding protein [Spirochaetaceae bacterium]|nr:TRAP transporter substrate-binding protein [Spirochaetaceae bacterium]